jgi:hypothetical protein
MSWRHNATVMRQQIENGRIWLVEGSPDLIQRLCCLLTTPYLGPLCRRKPHPFPLGPRHHL